MILYQVQRRAAFTFLFEAELNGDEVLKENIIDVGIVQVEELLEF